MVKTTADGIRIKKLNDEFHRKKIPEACKPLKPKWNGKCYDKYKMIDCIKPKTIFLKYKKYKTCRKL